MSDYKCPVCGETEELGKDTLGSKKVMWIRCLRCSCSGNPEIFTLKPERNQEAKAGALNELAKEIHENAINHGWWEEERSFGEIIALCHSELSEALEAYRNKESDIWDNNGKPDGIGVELADCIIRILDFCAYAKIDVEKAILLKHEYNKTRPYKHGGKVI